MRTKKNLLEFSLQQALIPSKTFQPNLFFLIGWEKPHEIKTGNAHYWCHILIFAPLSCNIKDYFTCLICFSPSNKYYHPIPCLPLDNCSILAVFIIYSYLCIYLFLAYISSLGCQAIRPQFWSVFVVLKCILVCLNVPSLLALQGLHSEISFIFWYLYYAH